MNIVTLKSIHFHFNYLNTMRNINLKNLLYVVSLSLMSYVRESTVVLCLPEPLSLTRSRRPDLVRHPSNLSSRLRILSFPDNLQGTIYTNKKTDVRELISVKLEVLVGLFVY